ncbi:hypothetical protein ABVT39_001794 [Epinephelus coioides]
MPSDNMKVLLLVTLLLLCSTQVLTLRCYTCDGNPDCKTETECPDSSQYCMTSFSTDGETISRSCVELCNTGHPCCSTDLCDPQDSEPANST